jgi:DNA-binding LytR/AlgR family response regulator
MKALDKGITVVGGSSMGALRASELDDLGMIGIGYVYKAYRSGEITSDDDVALSFDPVNQVPLSEALVNVDYKLNLATKEGIITKEEKDYIHNIAKEIYYPKRSYQNIFSKVEINSPVIVTTAYDQYAIQAFEVNAVDYLLKPIELKDMQRAVARIASGEAKAPSGEAVRNLLDQARKEKFLIKLNDRIVPVRVSDIAYFYSEDKNTYMVTEAGTTYVLDDSLDALVETLDPESFFRISRSCIIAEKSIDSVSKLMGGRLRISPKPGIVSATDFTVSRARVDGFMKWLER